MDTVENISDDIVDKIREELKQKGLKRAELNDKLFTEILDRMSLEDRLRMLFYCAVNDTFLKIKN